jgi:hypothetical protein
MLGKRVLMDASISDNENEIPLRTSQYMLSLSRRREQSDQQVSGEVLPKN